MHPAPKKRTTTRYWFYLAVALIALSVWGLNFYVNKAVNNPGPVLLTPLSDSQKMVVQVLSDTNRQLTTFATTLLGAFGFLLANKARDSSKSRHIWAAFLAAMGGGLSLYYGYMSHLFLVAMVNNEIFNPYDVEYRFLARAQFYTLLAGAIFLADFAVHDLYREGEK
jgi:uncharacterized membrane protein